MAALTETHSLANKVITSFTPDVEGHLESDNQYALVQLPCSFSQRVLALLLRKPIDTLDNATLSFRLTNTLSATRHPQDWKEFSARRMEGQDRPCSNLLSWDPIPEDSRNYQLLLLRGKTFLLSQLRVTNNAPTCWPSRLQEVPERKQPHNQRTSIHLRLSRIRYLRALWLCSV